VRDVAGAARAGVATAWVARGRVFPAGVTPPSYTVDRVEDLTRVLQ
jgi:putative hydrolase of the HAD superfamily